MRAGGRLVALGLAAAASAGFARYRRDLRDALQRVGSGSALAATPSGIVEYAEAGSGAPVLSVHGAGGGFDQGLAFAGPLAERGFRVVAMSRFGYLRTPLPTDASAAAQADAHAGLLDALQIDRAAVIGGSAGAPSSLQLALRHPDRVRALVLVVPALYVPRPDGGASVRTPPGTELLFDYALRSDLLFWAALRVARPMLVRALLATPPAVMQAASADERSRVDAMLEQIFPVTRRRLGLLNDARVTSTLERYDLERVTAPTLTISAADDLFGTYDAARYTAEQIAGARFIGYPSGGHVWVGRQRELLEDVHGFLTAA